MTTPHPLHPVMLAGTGSDVGKSVLVAALCRIFRQDGYFPAPFKAQNMALNSAATPDGREIGRAQAMQAEAAGIPAHTDMNPLLLKPQADCTAQVVLHGRPIGTQSARQYFRTEGRDALRREVCAAYDRLAARYSPVVMEGAGSLAEINLRDLDLVNLPMARHAGADVLLVGDIDRGGVFASVYGSLILLRPEERKMVKGIFINKFRGDITLFEEGRKMLESLCGIPVLGVIPYFKEIHIDEEDSVALESKSRHAVEGAVNVAVVLLRHMSNFTDFHALERDPRIHLYYTCSPHELLRADLLMLPGSKNTVDDLTELHRNGAAQAIMEAHRQGTHVLGICGGYQMMGLEVSDPLHVESQSDTVPGLGLLPVRTILTAEKVTRQCRFHLWNASLQAPWMEGYEIHMGATQPVGEATCCPLAQRADGSPEGCRTPDGCMGTYLHGCLDNGPFVEQLLAPFAARLHGVAPTDYLRYKEEQYDKLALHVRSHTDMPRLYAILQGSSHTQE